MMKGGTMRSPLLATVMIGALSLAFAGRAAAQASEADFFRGKTITYIVATAGGGGYDTYGRLLVRSMSKYMPGTRILVKNVPGAGNIIGANTIYAARPDGLTFGIFNTGLIYSQMVGLEGVRFDLGKMSWVGKLADEGRTLVLSKKSGLNSIQDLLATKETIRLASSGIGSASDIEMRMLQKMMGLNVRLITNIEGGETQLSMMRGEVAGVLEAASSNYAFVHQGQGKYVLSIAGGHSHLTGVPQARDFVTNAEHLRLLTLVETIAELGRPTAGPPGIPPARLNYLRDIYMKAANDPELRAQAVAVNIPVQPLRGDVVAGKIGAVLRQPPNVLALLKQAAAGK
jgi:tripartite-type tricarboxylate transporter receptor subunit TctC